MNSVGGEKTENYKTSTGASVLVQTQILPKGIDMTIYTKGAKQTFLLHMGIVGLKFCFCWTRKCSICFCVRKTTSV